MFPGRGASEPADPHAHRRTSAWKTRMGPATAKGRDAEGDAVPLTWHELRGLDSPEHWSVRDGRKLGKASRFQALRGWTALTRCCLTRRTRATVRCPAYEDRHIQHQRSCWARGPDPCRRLWRHLAWAKKLEWRCHPCAWRRAGRNPKPLAWHRLRIGHCYV
jgi:hypothetical protein